MYRKGQPPKPLKIKPLLANFYIPRGVQLSPLKPKILNPPLTFGGEFRGLKIVSLIEHLKLSPLKHPKF